ncbi:polysaccharide deacetylase family protein [Propionibacteriaceae bacterium G1746]|uniref:polysaccharide deacetylase family protein n=1 Tax=Aestuariimicrobium sp. G57 TaxID=3418485 RepID=UPI003C143D09
MSTPAASTRATSAAPTTTQPTTTRPPTTPDYSRYSNTNLSWWYLPGSPTSQDKPAAIDADVADLISDYDVIWRRTTSQKVVFLTMDEGYEFEQNSTRILDIAAAKNVTITFFITGGFLKSHPDLVRRMLREGHQVANHSERHLRPPLALDSSTDTFVNDVRNLERDYLAMMGRPIARLYRPPEGGYSERSLKITQDLGYTTVFWSFAYADWDTANQPDPAAARQKILGQLHPGSLLLLHTVSSTNVAILGEVIDGIRARGYVIGQL